MNPLTQNDCDVVLIVDDVPDNLALLCDALDEAGYEVLVATDGNSALERVRCITPDAILLDAVMPGLDGFETCRRIKAERNGANVPVIFMTALSETGSVVRGFDAGGVDYVAKPIDPDEVIARLAAHIRNSRAISETRRAIDTAGQALIVFDRNGAVVWSSSRVRDMLAGRPNGCTDSSSLDQLSTWIVRSVVMIDGDAAADRDTRMELRGGRVVARFVGAVAKGRYMCVLEPGARENGLDSLSSRFGLTPREVEVVEWIASGKTDRDIAEILGMRPRTVNKHLEHIYVKLGVETRTAAAATLQHPRS